MPEVDVERKGLSLDYHLQGIIEEMLKNATRHLIQLIKASDTLLEKAKEED